MLQTLAKVFSWKNKQEVSPAIKAVEDDIPRYPPFAKGLPSASVDRVVQTQDELVSKIKGILRFNTEEFGQYVLPVISRYAAHVHLLPASESHHHRGAGGLFRHGLEVGFWAAQQAESKQFTLNGTPQDKRNNEPKWQLAAFLGGLLHDVGKPLSDLAVVDESGNKIWNPYSHSLIAWANAEQVNRYFLRWRDKRHKRHETFSLLNIDRILTPETRSYLSSTGPEILEAMLESIAGTSAEQALTKIVMWADQQSVARDLKQHRLNVDEHAYGVPVERYVFDAMRRLIKSGRWKVNEPGGKVWLFQEGVFVAWKHAVKDIAVLIQDDQIPGVPRDADTLADILIERGYALTFQDKEDGPGNRYWPIRPTVLDSKGGATLYSLRLDSLDLLFTDEPPTATKGYVGHAALKMKSKAVAGSEADIQQNHKSTVQHATTELPSSSYGAGPEQWDYEQPPMDYPDYDHHELFDDLASPPEQSPQVMPGLPEDKDKHPAFASNPLASIGAVAGEITATNQFSSVDRKTKQPKPEKADSKPGKRPESVATSSNTDGDKSVVQEVPVPELSGDEGVQHLRKAVSLIEDGTHTLGQALYRMGNNRYSILYPDGAKLFGKQTEVMKSLDADGLLEPDPVSLKKVQEQNGIKMLVLSTKASQWVEYSLQLIEQGELLSAKAQPTLKEGPSVAKPKGTTKPSKPAVTSPSKNKKDTPEQKQKVPAKRKSKAKTVKLDKPMAEPPKVAAEKVVEKSEPSGASQNEFSVKMQIENIVKELKSQIKTGEGRWIVGSVDKWEGGVAVDIAALDKILEEYPFITKRKLRSKFIMNSAEWGLSSNKLTLKEQG